MSSTGFPRRFVRAASVAAAMALAAPAWGATWAGGRATPSLGEIVVLDATGEAGWPYGAEDVAGDGATFGAPEQGLDVRSGYAAVAAGKLFLRAYFSTTAGAPGAGVVMYFFIDGDNAPATGGKALAPEIDERFASDPTPGGYEYVVGVRGDGTVVGLWQWRDQQNLYLKLEMPVPVGEAGRDVDPLRVRDEQRGYVQATVDLSAVGVPATCAASFFFRSLNATVGASPAGDLDVGARGACVPADANND
ncbi:MAG TPA: hypothetical protein VFS00_22485, partial [Polyangiaceae bacterium]|nr:hypothetical protein [Polyangiaceae bacterium]